MKKLFKCLVIGLLSLGSFAAVAQDKQNAHEEIKLVLKKYTESVNDLNYDKAASIWLNSSEVSFIHPRGHEKGYEDIINDFYNRVTHLDLK